MDKLFVYGTLQPGGANEHILGTLDGTWEVASVRGRLLDEGWGASLGCPGLVLDERAPAVPGYLFTSRELSSRWAELDRFEGDEYERLVAGVTLENGELAPANIYVLKASE